MHNASCRVVSVLTLALAVASCSQKNALGKGDVQPEGARPAVQIAGSPAISQLGAQGATIADVAERVLPSVVSISMTKVEKTRPAPFFPFFGGGGEPGERRAQGMGSGVIVSADGYILTNNHVVEDAQEIKVTTSDKRDFDATVVGTDPKSDLAVIKIKGTPSGLRAVEFGDSSKLRLGDVVLAIGNPFGVGQTVTMGIVSAKGRADLGIVDYEDFIQTDAAINPGNSGGALIDTQGKLVGINTAILSRSGGYQGIGLAIPTAMAQPIMEILKQSGKVMRGWLGVAIQDVDQELAAALQLGGQSGVLLNDVKSGAPGAKAGLSRGDVVVKVDGTSVTSTGQFRNLIATGGAKRRVVLDVVRHGKPLAVTVELGEIPNDARSATSSGSPKPTAGGALDGVTFEELTPEHRRTLGLGVEVQKGVVITGLDPKSQATRAGLRPGDVVLEVNRTPVESLAKFRDLYGKASGDLLLLVHRRGQSLFLVVRK